MSMLCALLKKSGLPIGDNYTNKSRAREFISAIADTVQLNSIKDINSSSFISVLADGSTDVFIKEQEVVYVRYLSDGEAKTRFVSIEELTSSDAKGVKEGIENGLRQVGLTFADVSDLNSEKPTLVCANFDGASVMQGLTTGTMALIMEHAPWIIPMHCVAHKLELTALDSVKGDSYMRRFEDVIKGIFMFYHYSPKRRREVKTVAEFLECDHKHISGIKQVRWLASKTRALTALLQNLQAIVAHLEHVASRKSSDEAARAKGYLKDLTSIKFVMLLHAMVDILSITSNLSKVFQLTDLLVTDVYQQAEIHSIQLEALKHEQGEKMKEFVSTFNEESKMFGSVQLKGQVPSTDFIADILNDLIHYIDKRFSNFSQAPLKCFAALNYKLIPQDRTQLLKYGKEDLTTLLQHLPDLFPTTSHALILSEYNTLKVYMRDLQQTDRPSSDIYRQLLSKKDTCNVNRVVELMMVISPSTAECERGFSQMNLIKSDVRNCLNQESLRMLMTLKQHGPTFDDFCHSYFTLVRTS